MNTSELLAAINKVFRNHPEIQGNHTRLAEESGVPQATITRILNGVNEPGLSIFLKILEGLQLKFKLDEKVIELTPRFKTPDARRMATLLDEIEQYEIKNTAKLSNAERAVLIKKLYPQPDSINYQAEIADIIEFAKASRRK